MRRTIAAMNAIVMTKAGTPVAGNIKLVSDWPEPIPKAGEVVVRTEASALNHLDLWVGQGIPGLNLTYPRVSGSDGCGVIESIGEGVDSSWIGKRVILNAQIPAHDPVLPGTAPAAADRIMIGEHLNGTMAAKFAAPVANVIFVGASDPVEAAAFGLTHLTAWRMLVTRAHLRAGQSVLITGIGGGVALAALGIARHFACTTIVTSRHQSKLDRAKLLGAAHGVLDDGSDWSRQVRNLTNKRGVDICADSIGKAVHMSCIKSLARGGVLVTCGNTSGHDPATDLTRIYWNQLSVVGSTMGDMDEFRQVTALFRNGTLASVVDSVYDAPDAARAYARLESADQFGKIVVRWQ
jgi:NADPH:quinone reductase-like Zn-dependent oxidoreductase